MVEKETVAYAFPMENGVVQGSITKVIGGFLGQTADGTGFVIGTDENLIESFKKAAEDLAYEIIAQLENVDNLQKQIDFTLMIDSEDALIPAELGGVDRKLLMNVLSAIRTGGKHNKTTTGAGPVKFKKTNPMADLNNGRQDLSSERGITGDKLDEIINVVKSGDEAVIKVKPQN